MNLSRLLFSLSATAIFFTTFSPTPASASTNDFSFSPATFDYYLSKNSDNTSTMRVEESLTAIFPNFAQNHGITRCIPSRYRGVKSLDTSSFTVTRSASTSNTNDTEPFTTYTEDDLFCLRIGSADSYVTGTQTYHISYRLNNVILEPSNSKSQELYWDTNGTGWYQPFAELTAHVHLSPDIAPAIAGDPSCYVGSYGASGSSATSRCTIVAPTSSDDAVFTFSATDLAPGENLTLDLVFAPDTFKVKKDLTAAIIAALVLAVTAILSVLSFRATRRLKLRNQEKIDLAAAPKPVQYIPPKNLTVAQANELWLHSSPVVDSKIANLMELAVSHHIQLEKAESDRKLFKSTLWKIHIVHLDGVSDDQKLVLQILNHGSPISTGDVIDVKTQSYSSATARLLSSFSKTITSALETKGFFTLKSERKSEPLAVKYQDFEKRTLKGIETSNYLDGLKEYISLAETNRIKFLHSVKTADVSNQGIVKLYEKLLPYAIIFRREDSWLKELEKYYQLPDVSDPTWMMHGIYLSSRDFRSFYTATASSVSSATASSSSGSSGSGGGGFSGGGGGGGGGGGW